MTNDAKFLAEVKRRVAMALKFSSYGNAAEVLREDIPRLIAMIAARDDKLRVAQEECDKWRQEYQDLCPIATAWEERAVKAEEALKEAQRPKYWNGSDFIPIPSARKESHE